jgi:hypothetical protein
MKTQIKCSGPFPIGLVKTIIVGAGILSLALSGARADSVTNRVETTSLPTQAVPGAEAESGLITPRDSTSIAAPAEKMELQVERGDAMQKGNVIVLQEPDEMTLHRSGPLLELPVGAPSKDSPVVRLFEPAPQPLPPGGSKDSLLNESERPWPVIASGATMGNSWSEPDLYQAQGFIALRW